MAQKRCPACEQWKSTSEFSKHKNRADGLQAQCKKCFKEYRQKNREKLLEQNRQYQKTDAGKKSQKQSYARYMQTAKGKEKARERSRRHAQSPQRRQRAEKYYMNNRKQIRMKHVQWKRDNPHKVKAKAAVHSAMRAGTLPHISTQKCKQCGEQARDYHHWSYRKEHWLDVVPLCRSCHMIIHVESENAD